MIRNRVATPGVMNALQVGTDSEGGYLVPDEYVRPDRAVSKVA